MGESEEAEESEYDPDEKPKKGRGRPAGKKDSKKRSAKETKKDKKGKKEKDPNKPKRPLPGYFLFMADERSVVKEEHPDWKIGKELGKRWNTLDAARKKKYNDQAAKGKAKYEKKWKRIMTNDNTKTELIYDQTIFSLIPFKIFIWNINASSLYFILSKV